METVSLPALVIYALILYFAVGLTLPLMWWPRARFLKRVAWSGMPVRLYKSILPEGCGACALWVYGANCVVIDARWIERAGVEEISHILRHECGHLVLGHARFNTLLCVAGLGFLLPFFRTGQEYEAEVFACLCKDERVIST